MCLLLLCVLFDQTSVAMACVSELTCVNYKLNVNEKPRDNESLRLTGL